jgi:hypothetical protein
VGGLSRADLERARCHGNAVINGAPRHDAVFSDASLSAVRSAEIVAPVAFRVLSTVKRVDDSGAVGLQIMFRYAPKDHGGVSKFPDRSDRLPDRRACQCATIASQRYGFP